MVAGHVIECGPQATGGNYAYFAELPDFRLPGFPIAEVFEDGSSIITKHPGTGGLVSENTVTAQLLYEIGAARYAGPDATARFDTIRLTAGRSRPGTDQRRARRTAAADGQGRAQRARRLPQRDHVRAHGTQLALKERMVREHMSGFDGAEMSWTLARTDHPDAAVQEEAAALLHCVVRGPDPKAIGRAFSGKAIELALSSYPGFHVTAPPGDASPYGVFSAAYVPAAEVPHVAVLADGTRVDIEPPAVTRELAPVHEPALPRAVDGATVALPLGTLVGTRSGDKGGDANVGVWVRTDEHWPWLANLLTVEMFQRLLPETQPLRVTRHALPNLRALNFVVEGLLGEGVAYHARHDPQAKALGEWLALRTVDIPREFL